MKPPASFTIGPQGAEKVTGAFCEGFGGFQMGLGVDFGQVFELDFAIL